MANFKENEKQRLILFLQNSDYFSDATRVGGRYKNHDYPFCLPSNLAEENLFFEIRQSAMDFFASHSIKWHDGQNDKPSNHLCSSQVCCTNFLYPFANQPQALAALLRPVFPTLAEMLPIEDGQYVTFEWIGEDNYLNESRFPNQIRTRGANFTSADAAVKFKGIYGRVQIVLIEWKYTESYGGAAKWKGPSGQTRLGRYRPIYESPDCPLNKELIPNFNALFYEPFYQFMRQQFLAQGMEKAREKGAEVVSLLHIAPAHNLEFSRVTSPFLQLLGDNALTIWKKLVKTPTRFNSVNIEDVFSPFDAEKYPALGNWRTYISARYAWIDE